MERDYVAIISALRRKAADKNVTPQESEALTAKADELAEKYGVIESRRTSGNGQVPTWDEFVKTMNDRNYEHQAWAGGSRAGKTHYTTWIFTQPGNVFVYNNWLSDLDEKPEDNGNYEFPQEENFSD